ncbi:hypothetical protein [Pseudonocardia kunmingensis]|uniref:Uncharacterized protein n=1 Tax=Pseudonocardia kunmingensis TaxID=630975 RepID=A0A543DY98_9PSEU|nr:hypothetical protein [Pseudonocardia kunmingensis]TQM14305.1 hypothetical protein FB558_1067 [Pseudonocardia kunmingensis]
MRTVLADARRGHPGLYRTAVAMAALSLVTAALVVIDQRTLLGVPLWVKPLKFSVSIMLYTATLAWMLSRLPGRGMRRTGWVIVAALVVEQVIIVGQAARGVRSHFNDDTPFDALLFGVMGATITLLWLLTVAVALRFLREPSTDRVTTSAVRLGLLVGLLGMAVGFLMPPNGAHAVGVADGGPGLPFVGWSTTGGDLRIGHFVGMHALQLLPLLAAGLAALRHRLDETARLRVVRVAAAGYGALVVLVTWQALRGQPLLAPDAPTLAALAVVVLGTAGGLAAALLGAARRAATGPTPTAAA